MLNKTNTKLENVNYKREEAYLYNKKEKADKKRVEKLWGILSEVKDGRFVIPFECKEEFDFCESKIDYEKLDSAQKGAVNNITSFVVHKQVSAFDHIFPEDSDANELAYLVSKGNKTYLVNNEGFTYSRYIIELINF